MIVFIGSILAGIITGMGMGGGILLVPLLVFFSDTSQLGAQGLCLAFSIPTSALAAWSLYRQKKLDVACAHPDTIGNDKRRTSHIADTQIPECRGHGRWNVREQSGRRTTGRATEPAIGKHYAQRMRLGTPETRTPFRTICG